MLHVHCGAKPNFRNPFNRHSHDPPRVCKYLSGFEGTMDSDVYICSTCYNFHLVINYNKLKVTINPVTALWRAAWISGLLNWMMKRLMSSQGNPEDSIVCYSLSTVCRVHCQSLGNGLLTREMDCSLTFGIWCQVHSCRTESECSLLNASCMQLL